MALDWQVYCLDTLDKEPIKGCFGSGKDQTYLDWLLQAWGQTVIVAACALVVAILIGSIIGVMRTLPDSPILTRIGNWWVELFRNIPLLVQIFLWYHVLPYFIPLFADVNKVVLVVMGLGLFTSSRIAEQ